MMYFNLLQDSSLERDYPSTAISAVGENKKLQTRFERRTNFVVLFWKRRYQQHIIPEEYVKFSAQVQKHCHKISIT